MSSTPDLPQTRLLDPQRLAAGRRRLQADDPVLALARTALCRAADAALARPPASVMDKEVLPPSGDKHDYMSLGTYWWPDPEAPDGLPYVRRDGERNPAGDRLDRPRLAQFGRDVAALSQAAYFTGDQRCVAHAERLLQIWFLDPDTRMNPHLNYGQGIPGRCDGRGIGIIDTALFGDVLDAVGLLVAAGGAVPLLPDLRQWFAAYLDWLVNSPLGQDEAATRNNHGTWYDVQTAALALFVGQPERAREICRAAGEKRVAAQIEPDGSQPLELARTRSLDYATMNLRGMLDLGALARHVDVDLLNYEAADGRSIRRAVDWLTPYVVGEKEWQWQQITEFSGAAFFEVLRRAALYFSPAYEAVLRRLDTETLAAARLQLLYPLPAGEDPESASTQQQ